MERGIDVQMVLDHGHQHIDRDGDPDLSLDGVLRGAKESFDPLMLLDPLNQDFPLVCARQILRCNTRRQLKRFGHIPQSLHPGAWLHGHGKIQNGFSPLGRHVGGLGEQLVAE